MEAPNEGKIRLQRPLKDLVVYHAGIFQPVFSRCVTSKMYHFAEITIAGDFRQTVAEVTMICPLRTLNSHPLPLLPDPINNVR